MWHYCKERQKDQWNIIVEKWTHNIHWQLIFSVTTNAIQYIKERAGATEYSYEK